MLNKILNYFKYHATLFDNLKTRVKMKNAKFHIGWYGCFPPLKAGAAAVSYWFIKNLQKREDIQAILIPFRKKIAKSIFPKSNISTIAGRYLDCLIVFGLGGNTQLKINPKRLFVYQTLHFPIGESKREQAIVSNIPKSAIILAATKWALKEFRAYGFKKVCYLPHGVDTAIFKPSVLDTHFKVIFVSRLIPDKGIMPFLDAIPVVLGIDKTIKFEIFGYVDYEYPKQKKIVYGNYNAFLRKQAEIEKKLKEIIKNYPANVFNYPEWVDYHQINQIYQKKAVLVFPSNNEGFGVPIIEAMACGLPVIVLNKPPMNEMVIHNKTGFCLDADINSKSKYGMEFPSSKSIANSIITLKRNKKLYQRLCKEARKHVIKKYSLSDCIDILLSICKNEK